MDGQVLPRRGGLRRTSIVLTAIGVTVGLLAASGSVSANHDLFLRISTGAINGNGINSADFAGASADGRRVFFSTSEQLVASDTDVYEDVYQRFNGVTTRISRGAINGNGAFDATFAGASADGRRVFFFTREKLVASDTDVYEDVYQRFNGVTTHISAGAINDDDGLYPYHSDFAGASADGTRVFFTTRQKLVASDTDLYQDIYQRFNGVTTRISTCACNGNGAFDAIFDGASVDGTRVFFTTAERLVSPDTDGERDVYQRWLGTTIRISAGAINGNGAHIVNFDGASADGTRVFFSTTERLVASDNDNTWDVYQRFNGTTTRISAGAINGNWIRSAIFDGASADGTRVFFTTSEPLVASDTDNSVDIYQRFNGVTTRISTCACNGNGGFDANFAGASADGTRVFFTTAERLVSPDTDSRRDIYQRRLGLTTRISAGAINGNGAHPAYFDGASADGARVFFSTAERLVTSDTDSAEDVYERFNGLTTRISAGAISGNGVEFAWFAGASADGTSVFFNTDEQLVASDTDNVQDVYGAYEIP